MKIGAKERKEAGREALRGGDRERSDRSTGSGRVRTHLQRPGIGFLWAGNQFVPPGTQDVRPLPPGVMVIWPFDPKTTGLSAGREKGLVRIMLADTPYAHVIVPVPGLKGLFGE